MRIQVKYKRLTVVIIIITLFLINFILNLETKNSKSIIQAQKIYNNLRYGLYDDETGTILESKIALVTLNLDTKNSLLDSKKSTINKNINRLSSDNKRFYTKLTKSNLHIFTSSISYFYNYNFNLYLASLSVLNYNSHYYNWIMLVNVNSIIKNMKIDLHKMINFLEEEYQDCFVFFHDDFILIQNNEFTRKALENVFTIKNLPKNFINNGAIQSFQNSLNLGRYDKLSLRYLCIENDGNLSDFIKSDDKLENMEKSQKEWMSKFGVNHRDLDRYLSDFQIDFDINVNRHEFITAKRCT